MISGEKLDGAVIGYADVHFQASAFLPPFRPNNLSLDALT
jgi:hypothetical protein